MALAAIAALLVTAATVIAIRMAGQVEQRTEQQRLTQQRMARIAQALEAHWLLHGCTLPLGAYGADPDGKPVPGGTTVPWRTLGIPQAEAVDAWGRKISYARSGTISLYGAAPSSFTWALVSHGPTGLGGWVPGEPAGQQLPAPANPDEIRNANLTSPLQMRQERSGADVLPVDVFDDFLQWGTLDPTIC